MKFVLLFVLALGAATALPTDSGSFIHFPSRAETVKKLQDALKSTVDSLKEKLDEGKEKGDELITKANELADKLKELNADAGKHLREAADKFEGKTREVVHKLLERFHGPTTTTPRPTTDEPLSRSRRGLVDRLPHLPHLDEEETVRKICDTVVRLALPSRREAVKERCEKHARAVIRKLNGLNPSDPELENELEDETPAEYSLSRLDLDKVREKANQTAEQVKKFLSRLGVEVHQKYSSFAEFVKEHWHRGLARAHNDTTRLRQVAIKVKENATKMSAETLKQAVEALKPVQSKLGKLYEDIVAAAKEAAEKLGRHSN